MLKIKIYKCCIAIVKNPLLLIVHSGIGLKKEVCTLQVTGDVSAQRRWLCRRLGQFIALQGFNALKHPTGNVGGYLGSNYSFFDNFFIYVDKKVKMFQHRSDLFTSINNYVASIF